MGLSPNDQDSYINNPTSVGKLVATSEGEIRDADGKVLNTGEVGELHVRSPLTVGHECR